jgi:hypothetical protein
MMIEQFAFGRIVVNGVSYTSDIKIIRGKIVPEWWRKRGHWVEVDDIEDILASDPKILVIGKGKPGLMKSSDALRELLNERNIERIEEKTSKAVLTFNRFFKEGKAVAAGFHVGC